MVSIALVVSLLAGGLSVPPARSLIEQSMFWHMVVQMPALVLGGWLLSNAFSTSRRPLRGLECWNEFGLTSFIGSQIIFAYWMLPVAIDRAVVLPSVDLMKLLSILVGGALLRHSAQRSPTVVQLFFLGSTVSMLLTAGVVLTASDRRLCNAYTMDSQVNAGLGVLVIGFALGSAWTLRVMHRSREAGLQVRL